MMKHFVDAPLLAWLAFSSMNGCGRSLPDVRTYPSHRRPTRLFYIAGTDRR